MLLCGLLQIAVQVSLPAVELVTQVVTAQQLDEQFVIVGWHHSVVTLSL